MTLDLAAPLRLRPAEIHDLRKIMRDRFGLELRPGKEGLAEARLAKYMRDHGCPSFHSLCARLEEDGHGDWANGLADALTTNHTSMFREPAHFRFLRDWLSQHSAGREKIRIWSAGCATGEEVYSIACCSIDALGWDIAARKVIILGTDLSASALATATDATYPPARFAELPLDWRRKFLLRTGRACLFKPEVRAMVRFRRLNLIEPRSGSPMFPLVFCRNVMIYFDAQIQQRVVNLIASYLEPGGYLMIGHCESLDAASHGLAHVAPAIYQKSRLGSVQP